MAYRIVEPNINVVIDPNAILTDLQIDLNQANETALGTSVSSLTSNFLTTNQAFENLKNLLLTQKGERYYQPTFGTDLIRVIFEQNTQQLQNVIQDIIEPEVAFWLPYIEILDIQVDTSETDPSLIYVTRIKITFSVSTIDTNTITIGVTDNGQIEIS